MSVPAVRVHLSHHSLVVNMLIAIGNDFLTSCFLVTVFCEFVLV